MEAARRQRDEPASRSSPTATLFGDLADDERFVTAYRAALESLHERGARATLTSMVGEEMNV